MNSSYQQHISSGLALTEKVSINLNEPQRHVKGADIRCANAISDKAVEKFTIDDLKDLMSSGVPLDSSLSRAELAKVVAKLYGKEDGKVEPEDTPKEDTEELVVEEQKPEETLETAEIEEPIKEKQPEIKEENAKQKLTDESFAALEPEITAPEDAPAPPPCCHR